MLEVARDEARTYTIWPIFEQQYSHLREFIKQNLRHIRLIRKILYYSKIYFDFIKDTIS